MGMVHLRKNISGEQKPFCLTEQSHFAIMTVIGLRVRSDRPTSTQLCYSDILLNMNFLYNNYCNIDAKKAPGHCWMD